MEAELQSRCNRQQGPEPRRLTVSIEKTRCHVFAINRVFLVSCISIQLLVPLHLVTLSVFSILAQIQRKESHQKPRPLRNRNDLSCVRRRLLASNARKDFPGAWVIACLLWEPFLTGVLLSFSSQQWPLWTLFPGCLGRLGSGWFCLRHDTAVSEGKRKEASGHSPSSLSASGGISDSSCITCMVPTPSRQPPLSGACRECLDSEHCFLLLSLCPSSSLSCLVVSW